MIDRTQIERRDTGCAVLLSGGQDSTTCLAWATEHWRHVTTVSFDYGQRHRVELEQAERIAEFFGVQRMVLPVPALSMIGAASLTNDDIPSEMDAKGTGNRFAAEHDLPSSFVPGRNVILLATALAWAAPQGIYELVTGVCEADDAGYPDCRGSFVESMEATLRVALDDDRVQIAAPLLHLDKAGTFELASDLNVLRVVLELSHTCYNGDRSNRFEWGYGCGECPACQTRAKGYEDFQSQRAPV